MSNCIPLILLLIISPIFVVCIIVITIKLLKNRRFKTILSLIFIAAVCILLTFQSYRALFGKYLNPIIFSALLLLPILTYKVRLLRANERVIRADVNSGYKFSLMQILAGLNLSVKEHVLVFYGVYSIFFSIVASIIPTLGVLYAIQILNGLIILCFIWILIHPLPEPFSVMSRITLNANGRIDFTKRKHDYMRYTKMYESHIFIKFQNGFNQTRAELYKGFWKFQRRQDIISFLSFQVKQYTREIESLQKQPLFSRANFYMCDLQSNKVLLFCIFLLTLSTNYLTLFCGCNSHILMFKDMGAGLVAPLYFLLTTFATVGYGDIVQSSNIDKIFCISLLLQLILFVFVVVNIINDQSESAIEKFNKPSKQILEFLLSEANILIHQVETGMFDKDIDKTVAEFQFNPEIAIFLTKYKDRIRSSDNYSI